jgi:hypothetical protein
MEDKKDDASAAVTAVPVDLVEEKNPASMIDTADDAIAYLESTKANTKESTMSDLPLKPADQSRKNIIILCDRKILHFFEDYINSLHNLFHLSIFLYVEMDMVEKYLSQFMAMEERNMPFFIFMQYIPVNVMNQIQQYITHKFKMGIFNTEQLSKKEFSGMINAQHPFFYRVDYSEVNLLVVANELNHKKIYIPYQVHPREIHVGKVQKDRAICIISPSESPRRHKIIHDLQARGIQIDIVHGFREARDAELFRYKILLNVHYADDYNIFEEMRCVRAIFNQMIVISEKSWYDDIHLLRRHFLVCEYDQIVAKVVDVLINYDLYHSHLFRSFDKLMPVYDADLQAIAQENVEKVWTA